MNGKPLIVILGRQRTGTTALAEALGSGPVIHSSGEVFHHKWNAGRDELDALRLDEAASYFQYRAKCYSQEPLLSVPTIENQRRLFHGFMSQISAHSEKPVSLISVKYNSIHHFEPVYRVHGVATTFLMFLREINARIIHVKRPAYFDRYCSEQLAMQRGVWHEARGEAGDAPAGLITIDCGKALQDMQESHRLDQDFDRYLSRFEYVVRVNYGEMIKGEHLNPAIVEQIDSALGIPSHPGKVPLKKVVPRLKDMIANRNEVAEFFSRTPFSGPVLRAIGIDEPTIDGAPAHAEQD